MAGLERERLLRPISESRPFEPLSEILRFDPKKILQLAETITGGSLKVTQGDRVLVSYNPGGTQLAGITAYLAARKGAAVLPRCTDPLITSAILAGVAENQTPSIMNELAAGLQADIAWATKVAIIGSRDFPDAFDTVPPEILNEFNRATYGASNVRVNRRSWVLTSIPTRREAERDNRSYGNYITMFFNACNRPWSEVKKAQQILIDEILNPGKELTLRAGALGLDRQYKTELTMGIKGQTFANSTIGRNIPGSEVFSGPQRGTIHGRLTIPYPLTFGERVIPNVTLVFKDGRVVEHFVESNNPEDSQWVEKKLNMDEGAREVGEVALGTNPALDRPLLNALLIEKVGVSFHIALGSAYQLEEYDGEPVHTDNGVRSGNHIDITCMMLPRFGGGQVLVDGTIIQEKGGFRDPRLAILNPSQ